ncbi:MAG TPA: hypothetical protein DIT64_09615 [Verrucomicrobiales bacterium]|nr:hypothetical protein [Verrucomicrobiales bacterium]
MKHPFHSRHLVFFSGFLAVFVVVSRISAQTSSLTVLSRQVVEAGDHKIIFERVTPPVRPAQTAPSTVLAESAASKSEPEPEMLLLSCTVHQGEMTEVRWQTARGEFTVWSSINFHLLGPVDRFEHEGWAWRLSYGIGDEAELLPALTAFRALPQPGSGAVWYHVAQAPAGAVAEDYAGVHALHRYFEANRAELETRHAQRLAENAARAVQRAANPPVKQDTVIRFWPVQSALHLGTSTEGKEAGQ